MDTIYDLGRLNQDELFELRAIQRKMQDENSAQAWPRHVGADVEYTRLTLEEAKRLERLYYKMRGEPYPCEHEFEQTAPYEHERATWHVEILPCYSRDYPGYKIRDSGVTAAPSQPVASNPPAVAPKPAQPAEPVAIAPSAPSIAAPAAPAPAPAEKLKLPSDSVMSAHRQLDALMRFGREDQIVPNGRVLAAVTNHQHFASRCRSALHALARKWILSRQRRAKGEEAMTLILAWVTKQFAVAACDGKAIHKHADGRIESASENENNASAELSKAFNQTP